MAASEEIFLRPYRPDDAEPVYEAAHESVEQIFPWMEWCHPGYSLDESKAWIAHCESGWEAGSEYEFVVVDLAGRILGGCGLNHIKSDHRMANLGYWVRSSATRRGVATAAVGKLKQFAFTETNLIRLEIVVAVGNVASQGVAEKAGALNEGIAHDRLYLHGKPHDAHINVLLRSRHADL